MKTDKAKFFESQKKFLTYLLWESMVITNSTDIRMQRNNVFPVEMKYNIGNSEIVLLFLKFAIPNGIKRLRFLSKVCPITYNLRPSRQIDIRALARYDILSARPGIL